MLAGIIQSPSRWDPAKNREKSQERWNFVLDGMAAQGWLPGLDRGLQRFPDFLPEPPALPGIPADSAGHLYTQAKAELETRGITAQEIDTEGLIVELTVDSNRQKQASSAGMYVEPRCAAFRRCLRSRATAASSQTRSRPGR